MGIDFSHGEAHWSYSGFNRFRNKLAEALGFDVPSDGIYGSDFYMKLEEQPIFPLINHSDCDGNLTVEEMEQTLPQLEKIVDMWADDLGSEKGRGTLLIESMKAAIAAGKPLEFI